ncbi:MAG: NUDIX hydrolase [Phycisphaerales bacterium]
MAHDPAAEDAELARGRWLRLIDRGGWELAERVRGHAVVCVAACTTDNKVIFVEQYRPALRTRTIELPAGIAGDTDAFAGEASAAAAARELEEETGWSVAIDDLVAGPELASSGGLTSETVQFFVAARVTRTGPGGGDEHEDITVHTVPIDSVDAWLDERMAEGRSVDAKVHAGLRLLERWRQGRRG